MYDQTDTNLIWYNFAETKVFYMVAAERAGVNSGRGRERCED
jgi:hypothetical protein